MRVGGLTYLKNFDKQRKGKKGKNPSQINENTCYSRRGHFETRTRLTAQTWMYENEKTETKLEPSCRVFRRVILITGRKVWLKYREQNIRRDTLISSKGIYTT